MKKIRILLVIAAVVIAGIVAAYFSTHVSIGGQMIPRSATSLDISGKPIQDFDKILKLNNLKELNAENTGMTVEQYAQLKSARPECQIRWLVPFQGAYYSPDTQELTVSALSLEDVAVLDYFPQLSYIDAAACRDYDCLTAAQQAKPGCKIDYTVVLAGKTIPGDVTTLDITCDDPQELDSALALLPKLESIRISGCQDAMALNALEEKYPNCDFSYDVSIGGQHYPKDITSLTIASDNVTELEAVLPCFSGLTDVTVAGNFPEAKALADAYPEISFHFGFELLGQEVHTDQEFLDLSGITLQDTQAIDEAMPYFHNLQKVDMVGCGLDNEVMGDLNARHPGTLFVWKVLIGERYYRTDITYFYPSGSHISMVHVDLSNLKYCTEMVALDLGHFLVDDCSFVAYMPKLQYLIVAIGPLEDVRPIGTLKNLKYLEIFSTDVTNYWPLINCTSLEDLNLSFSGHGDITPLLQMPWLNRLWLSCNKEVFSEEEKATLAQHLPNTIMVFSSGSATNKGWRNSPNYYAMRDFLGTGYMVA